MTHFRPVEPKTVLPVTVPSAHGALITELSSTSTTPFDPYFARPIVDSTAHRAAARLGPARASRQAADRDHLEARDDEAAPPRARHRPVHRAAGRQRDRDAAAVPAHQGARLLGPVERTTRSRSSAASSATGVGATVAFSVETRDQAPNGANDVVRVRVGYLDQPDGGTTRTWRFVDLVQDAVHRSLERLWPARERERRLPVLRPVGRPGRQRRRLDEQGRSTTKRPRRRRRRTTGCRSTRRRLRRAAGTAAPCR